MGPSYRVPPPLERAKAGLSLTAFAAGWKIEYRMFLSDGYCGWTTATCSTCHAVGYIGGKWRNILNNPTYSTTSVTVAIVRGPVRS